MFYGLLLYNKFIVEEHFMGFFSEYQLFDFTDVPKIIFSY